MQIASTDLSVTVFVKSGRTPTLRAWNKSLTFLLSIVVLGLVFRANALSRNLGAVQFCSTLIATLLLNSLQRLITMVLFVARDLYAVVDALQMMPTDDEDDRESRENGRLSSVFLATMHFVGDDESIPVFAIQSASLLALLGPAWVVGTFLFDERIVAIAILLLYEIVPLVDKSVRKGTLLRHRIFAVCFQALVFAKANCLFLPGNSPLWFPALLTHVLVPILANAGDIAFQIF